MDKGIQMTADQGGKITAHGEIDELTLGKAKDGGKTLHLLPCPCGKLQSVETSVHLALQARFGFKADDRLPLRLGPDVPQSVPQDADRPGIARDHQFFKDPLTGYPGIFFRYIHTLILPHRRRK